MVDQTRLDDQLAQDEGFRSTPYKDTRGLWTLGIGRCVEMAPLSSAEWAHLLATGDITVTGLPAGDDLVKDPFTGTDWRYLLNDGELHVEITRSGAEYLLHAKEAMAIAALQHLLPNWGTMNDARQNALIDEAYQLGDSFLLGWPQTLAALRNSDWDGVATNEMKSEWATTQTPARASRLIAMLKSGKWPQ